jgi:hypothetical protein
VGTPEETAALVQYNPYRLDAAAAAGPAVAAALTGCILISQHSAHVWRCVGMSDLTLPQPSGMLAGLSHAQYFEEVYGITGGVVACGGAGMGLWGIKRGPEVRAGEGPGLICRAGEGPELIHTQCFG